MPHRSSKKKRQETILELIRTRRVRSQDELARLLGKRGHAVSQATLSRDLRELRVAKVPHAEGESYYAAASDTPDPAAGLEQLLPHLLTDADGVDNLIVVKTVAGGAQAVAEAIDLEAWPELLGTVAGDDTILLVLRDAGDRARILRRIDRLAHR
jgi:transcriptional regulator of arginine metabolism